MKNEDHYSNERNTKIVSSTGAIGYITVVLIDKIVTDTVYYDVRPAREVHSNQFK